MRLLLRATVLYLLVGGLFVAFWRENPADLLWRILAALPASLGLFMELAWWAIPVLGGMLLLVPRASLLDRLPSAIVAVFVGTLFFLIFSTVKTTMPYAMDFWADPYLARLDRAIHLGTDPWAFTHRFSEWVNLKWASGIYFGFWALPALYTPVVLILIEADKARQERFFLLYFFVWIGLGNVLALAFLSAGPVFYDRLVGGDSFAGLTAALKASGVTDSGIGLAQAKLWRVYTTGAQEAGSGISAFPSVHIGIVTMMALYLYERQEWLALPGAALVAVFLFLSVYLGWHYAVDGYFSIVAVWSVWFFLRKRGEKTL